MRKLKILSLHPPYGGSLSIAKYCTNTLIRLGHKVEVLDYTPFYPVMQILENITHQKRKYIELWNILNLLKGELLYAKCLEFKPELVFGVAQSMVQEGLKRVKELGIPVAYWFVEDYKLFKYWRELAKDVDFFFTIQKDDFFRELNNLGVKNYFYLPTAADENFHTVLNLTPQERKTFGSDISFVGAGYYNRQLSFLRLLDFDFKIWGTEWDYASPLRKVIQRKGKRIDEKTYIKIYNATKININLHSSISCEGVDPFGDFVNPRTFEIASCGGFQLVDERKYLPELFEPGKEIITFKDIDELREKIKYYLTHEKERKEIAERARKRILSSHTYTLRLRQMVDTILEHEPTIGEKGESVKSLIKSAKDDPELVEFLSQFDKDQRITLTDIINKIHKGKGKITFTEGIFLFMDKFSKRIQEKQWKS